MSQKPKKNTVRPAEEDQLEQEYRKITGGRYARPRKRSRAPLIAGITTGCLVLLAVLAGGLFMLFSHSADPCIPEGVTAMGISLGGLTKEQAVQVITAADRYRKENMTVTVLDTELVLSPSDTGAELNAEGIAEDAWRYGKSQKNSAASRYAVDISDYLELNTDFIRQQVENLGKEYNTEYVPSGWNTEGTRPSADEAGMTQPAETLVLTVGSPGCSLDTAALYDEIIRAYEECRFEVTAECTCQEPEPIDLPAIQQQTSVAVRDAVMDPDTFEVTEEQYGYGFDLASAEELLKQAEYGDILRIPFALQRPAVTAESLRSVLYRDVLAEVSTKHTDDTDRNTNLRIACEAVNGMILNPGDVFSYNDALGERTEEKGYRPGASYAGGEIVYTYGGGICQVSSSLYYAALQADLEIVDRDCHMFPPSYIPYGMDATVNWGTIDFQFRNNTNYPIRIEADVSDGCVNVSLIGTDEKTWYVKMEYEVDETYGYDTVYREYPPDNEQGYTDGQVLTWPTEGIGVSTYRCRYDKETDELISRDFEDFSAYDHQDEVIVKIVPPETEPAETSPAESGPVTEATG